MKTISRIALILVTVTATAAFAKEEPKDPTVKARTELMETVGQNMKVLGDMAGEKAAFDAAAATAATMGKAKLLGLDKQIIEHTGPGGSALTPTVIQLVGPADDDSQA